MEQKSVCDEKTFRIIFDTHSETIRNFLYNKCKDIQQAEDLTQDAFIKLWKNCKKVAYEKAKSFVMKVGQNTFYNEVAHDKVILKYNEYKKGITSFSESPEFVLEEKEFMHKLQRSISDLPDKEREVFLLSRKDKKPIARLPKYSVLTKNE